MNIPYEKQTGAGTLVNMDQQQSTEAPVKKEKQQLLLEVGSEEKQKKEGGEEIVFVQSKSARKRKGCFKQQQQQQKTKRMMPKYMDAEIHITSLLIVVIDDVEDKPKVQKIPSDVITQLEQMEVDKSIATDGNEIGEDLKKSVEV